MFGSPEQLVGREIGGYHLERMLGLLVGAAAP
jgi:hypothetical protein